MMRALVRARCSALSVTVCEDQSALWLPLYVRPKNSSVLGLRPLGTKMTDSTDSAELIEA